MIEPFGPGYAAAYDDLYADKDYDAECELIEEVLRRYAHSPVRSILDLGCGTGGHALPLARRGYEVTGVDRSTEMLAHAQGKPEAMGLPIEWRQGDARSLQLGRTFDAALLMFAVLSYQRANDEVAATLDHVREHLREGGLLVLDAWHGPGVLTDPPGHRRKVAEASRGRITRVASAELDVRHHLCRVEYELSDERDREASRTRETHVVRYFFPMELDAFLERAGFSTLVMSPFGALDDELGERTWTMLAAARAV